LLLTAQSYQSLPESDALLSVGLFVECLLSGTRQIRLCREPHSVNFGSLQRASLPSAKHSAQDPTRQRHVKHSAKVVLSKGPSAAVLKLTAVSLYREPRIGTRQRGFIAECQILGTRQRTLCRVSSLTLGKVYFYFLDFVSQIFCGMFLHYVDLHASFVDNYNRVFNR
jgi:hypothetical protein